jgi:hypothetical protein
MDKKIFQKCERAGDWKVCRFLENDLLMKNCEKVTELIKDCYKDGNAPKTCKQHISNFLRNLCIQDNHKFQETLMLFVTNCEKYPWPVAQYATGHVKESPTGSIAEAYLLELAQINLFWGSWKDMQIVAVTKMIAEDLTDALNSLANKRLRPVWERWTDTWDSEHSGITHYLGLHPNTQKMAKDHVLKRTDKGGEKKSK